MNMLDIDNNPHKINYESKENICITECPFGQKDDFGFYILKVGSNACQSCVHFEGMNQNTVFCKNKNES